MSEMVWFVSTPSAEFSYDSRVGYSENIGVLDDYMKFNDNVVRLPSYPAAIDYKRRDPKNRYWAALMYAQDWWQDNYSTFVSGWEPVEPIDDDAPADARF
jgi:hypothetical protein